MSQKAKAFLEWQGRWERFATTGQGKEKATFDEYHYDGDTMFSNRRPWQRLICNDKGQWMKLVVTIHYNMEGLVHEPTHGSFSKVYLPCVGVFTPFPNDRMHGADLLERLRFVMLSQTIWLATELIPSTPAMQLAAMPGNQAFDNRPEYLQKTMPFFKKRLADQYTRYEYVRDRLAPEWPPMPSYIIADAVDLMTRKVKVFNSPQAQEKRQRERAKRIANKVLDSN